MVQMEYRIGLLHDFAPVLCTQMYAIYHTSIQEILVLIQWKMANITEIPKATPLKLIEYDLRPILLTDNKQIN